AGSGTTPDELGGGGVLEGAGAGLGAVQRGDQPGQFVVAGPGEPVILARGVLRGAEHDRAARGGVQWLAGGEPARGAGVDAGEMAGGAGLAGAAAAQRGPGGGQCRGVPEPGD